MSDFLMHLFFESFAAFAKIKLPKPIKDKKKINN